MRDKFAAVLLLLLVILSCTAWAAEEQEELIGYEEAELFQCGSVEGAQTLPDGPMLLYDRESAYQRIYDGLYEKLTKIDLEDFQIPTSEIKTLYEQVINDHPELFYVSGGFRYFYITTSMLVTSVEPSYLEGLPEDAWTRMEEAVDRALAQVEPGMSEAEKALVLHDYLMNTVAYNWQTATTGIVSDQAVYTSYGALVNGDAVCEGYALAYQQLLKLVGLDSVKVSSKAMNHAWNLVKVDGTWYHVDVTWDDPVPNVEGGGRHIYFLRSDAGIQEESHFGWDAGGITCSAEYQDDWWLYEVQGPVYRWEGAYYYLDAAGTVARNAICKTQSLEDPGAAISRSLASSFSSRNGIQWVDGQLYYSAIETSSSRSINRCELASGGYEVLGSVAYTREPSEDGHYTSGNDGMGLRYDEARGEILVSSATRPALILDSFPVRAYPVSWDKLPADETTLAGGILRDSTLLAGLIWAEPGQTGGMLVVSFYQDANMVKALVLPLDSWESGLHVLELDVGGVPAYDRAALFLLSEELAPYCDCSVQNAPGA